MSYDPRRLLGTLAGSEVDAVLMGGLGGAVRGSPLVSIGVEVCHSRSARNLDALARVLADLGARLRGGDAALDTAALATVDTFRVDTDAGPLDCIGTPRGTTGYADIARRSEVVDLGGFGFRVASLDDLIRMKRAAGHPRDRAELEVLEALREEVAT
ncbi:MAG: hypothetical protein H0W70_05875 [Actinobacteria bacterium]|nr:hypothetical protein [Actinomycetota bacterium]